MLQITGLICNPASLDGTEADEVRFATRAVLKKLHLQKDQLAGVELRRRSIDARGNHDVKIRYTVRCALKGGPGAERALLAKLAKNHADKNIAFVEPEHTQGPAHHLNKLSQRVVVVGAGCAGLFAALRLAQAGAEPLLIERGDAAFTRERVVAGFDHGAALDPESNIQFGVGGAGTFSDGKLATGTKSKLHRHILETFVEAGAARDILWDSHPHVGSDVLPRVVDNLCRQIESLGGEVRTRTKMVDIDTAGGQLHSITLLSSTADGLTIEEKIPASHVVLACGHSARDVFELLSARGVALERKTFAMGVRIEHLQADIDRAQYGKQAGLVALGASPYKLVSHLKNGRSAFSFCMCPGGYVVAAASEEGGVVTNGMSLAARDGVNANSGLLANVLPKDLPGDDALAGVYLQRQMERAAFELGGGTYAAPAQLVGDFLQNTPSSAVGNIIPTYPRGVAWTSVDGCLPAYVSDTLRAALPDLGRKLKPFSFADGVLTGVESRSSSPVRVTRSETAESITCRGLYPAGEGAGYAGGIMSAATDGIRVADALIEHLFTHKS